MGTLKTLMEEALVECPACGGEGVWHPRATAAMWLKLTRWDAEPELCPVCAGLGKVPISTASQYEEYWAEE